MYHNDDLYGKQQDNFVLEKKHPQKADDVWGRYLVYRDDYVYKEFILHKHLICLAFKYLQKNYFKYKIVKLYAK